MDVILASKRFTRTLMAVTLLTFVLLAAMIYLSVAIPDPTKSQSDTMNNVSRAFFACVGALVGLLGGKLS